MELKNQIIRILETNHILSLGTADGGHVHVVSLFYAHRGLDLYFVSSPDSLHMTQAALNQRVSLTIHESTQDFRSVRGLQIAGTVSRVEKQGEKVECLELFKNKYSFMELFLKAKSLKKHLFQTEFYKITPVQITLIDNTKGFGHKETWSLEENQAP